VVTDLQPSTAPWLTSMHNNGGEKKKKKKSKYSTNNRIPEICLQTEE
jgi:hypothetical protein